MQAVATKFTDGTRVEISWKNCGASGVLFHARFRVANGRLHLLDKRGRIAKNPSYSFPPEEAEALTREEGRVVFL